MPQDNRLRERTTTVIAAVVIIGFVVLITVTTLVVGDNTKFANMKDLLAVANPLAGVVVGFYFTKATVEPRAEQAETAARTAQSEATAAQHEAADAQHARGTAEIDAERYRAQAREATMAVEAVTQAADTVLKVAAGPDVLGSGGAPQSTPELDALRAAVKMARRLTADAGPADS
jgi:hypothetical protein